MLQRIGADVWGRNRAISWACPRGSRISQGPLPPPAYSPSLFAKAVTLGEKPPHHHAQRQNQQQGQSDAQAGRRLVEADHGAANAVDEVEEGIGPGQPAEP